MKSKVYHVNTKSKPKYHKWNFVFDMSFWFFLDLFSKNNISYFTSGEISVF